MIFKIKIFIKIKTIKKNTTTFKEQLKPLKIKRNVIKGLKSNGTSIPDTESTFPIIGTSIIR